MAEFLYNSVVSYVGQAAGIQEGDTSFQLTDTALFPTVCNYRITVDNEIMLVTSCVAGLLTVSRGIEGTVATAHANLTAVFLVITAGGLAEFVSESGGGGGGFTGVAIFAYNAGSMPLTTGGMIVPIPNTVNVLATASGSSVLFPNSGVTMGTAGQYFVQAWFNTDSAIPGDMSVAIMVNGGLVAINTSWSDSAGGYGLCTVELALLATDEIEISINSAVGTPNVISAYIQAMRVG